MEKYLYFYRDKKLSCFSNPIFENMDSEHFAETIARSCKLITPDQYADVKDKALYILGTFDDISGKFSLLSEPRKLIDLEDYVPTREEILKDVTSEVKRKSSKNKSLAKK